MIRVGGGGVGIPHGDQHGAKCVAVVARWAVSGRWHRRWSIYPRKPAIFWGGSTNVSASGPPNGVAVREPTDHRLPALTPSAAAALTDPLHAHSRDRRAAFRG